MHKRGYTHGCLSTARDNYRGQLFYSNFGYEVVDWGHGWGRDFGGEGEGARALQRARI